MNEIRGWIIYSWIALPTVMYGGYALMQLFSKADALTEFRRTWFRAGHAHAGVLLVMSLVFYSYLEKTTLSLTVKHIACAIFVAGVLAQSGGFFIHMVRGRQDKPSVGMSVTSLGAVLLTGAIGVLVFGLLRATA
jgi:hypothetical protein